MAMNFIGTPYDDGGNPLASTKTGRTNTGLTGNYGAGVVAGRADPANALAANVLIPVAAELFNGATFDQPTGLNGVANVSSGGSATAAIASGTASDTVVKAAAGRLCRISVTAAAGTTTGNTSIYDNASGHTGTVLVVVPNSTAVGTVLDVQMPAANGITVNGGANSPGMTISYV